MHKYDEYPLDYAIGYGIVRDPENIYVNMFDYDRGQSIKCDFDLDKPIDPTRQSIDIPLTSSQFFEPNMYIDKDKLLNWRTVHVIEDFVSMSYMKFSIVNQTNDVTRISVDSEINGYLATLDWKYRLVPFNIYNFDVIELNTTKQYLGYFIETSDKKSQYSRDLGRLFG